MILADFLAAGELCGMGLVLMLALGSIAFAWVIFRRRRCPGCNSGKDWHNTVDGMTWCAKCGTAWGDG